MKILLIEDDPNLLELTREALERERYVVESAQTYRQALEKIAAYDYECILLDIMLPDGDGLNLLSELKRMRKQESVIVISARGLVDDRILGLELGADDYLAKPFHLSELIARVRSAIRRRTQNGDTSLVIGNVEIFPDSFRVEVAGKAIELGRKEYNLLLYLVNRRDRLITREAIAEAVWGDHVDQADNFDFIYAQVKNLRRKLRDSGASIELKSVYGVGYKLLSH